MTKRPLAIVAIVLAIVAVAMLAIALWSYRRKQRDAAPPLPQDAASVPVDAAPPDEGSVQFVDPWGTDDGGVAGTPSTCQPCDATCRLHCTCKDGTSMTSWSCHNGCCASRSKTCDTACATHGGAR
jgi:hypothetical protein